MSQASEYALDRFYCKSTTTTGQHTTLRVNLPNTLLVELAELVASKRVPEYKTVQDVVRDAITHRNHYLVFELHIHELQRPMDEMIALSKMQQLVARRKGAESLLLTFKNEINATRSVEEQRELVVILREAAETMLEPYKSEAEGLLVQYRNLRVAQ